MNASPGELHATAESEGCEGPRSFTSRDSDYPKGDKLGIDGSGPGTRVSAETTGRATLTSFCYLEGTWWGKSTRTEQASWTITCGLRRSAGRTGSQSEPVTRKLSGDFVERPMALEDCIVSSTSRGNVK